MKNQGPSKQALVRQRLGEATASLGLAVVLEPPRL